MNRPTQIFLVTMAVLILVWEGIALASPTDAVWTITQEIRSFNCEHPWVGPVFGIILGHLFWCPNRKNKAQQQRATS